MRSFLDEMMAQQVTLRSGPPAPRNVARDASPDVQPRERESGQQGQEGLYIISVAARILAMHPQTLRKYERVGLVRPSRTIGMLRLYSEEDIAKLRMIKRLVEELHLNLAGVEMAMAVFERLSTARMQMGSRSSSTSRTFDRMFDEIMDLFEGTAPQRRQVLPEDGNR